MSSEAPAQPLPGIGGISRFLSYAGGLTMLLGDAARYIVSMRFRFTEVIHQAYFLGVESAPIIVLTSAFTGMVISLEAAAQAVAYGFATLIGGSVAFGELRELGPILTGIVFAGRAGAAVTAQLGSMVVTEQVEALQSMGVSPAKVLVAPRLLACVLTVPMLTIFADIVGVTAGFLMAQIQVHLPGAIYWRSVQQTVIMSDFTKGLFKAAVFGLIVGLVACYEGLRARGGAEGVGKVTTHAVVTSIILIFAFNFLLSFLIF
ncbi:MAG TPA: ABC transporter permease [Candidatus Eremiobacteraceae bacterium]|nr:ABC transporter permease [Candidatus Eremiobacteraceae bacterium]